MKEIKAYLTIGYPAAQRRELIEMEDDATGEEIDEAVKEWAWEYIEYGWREDKGNDH